MRPSDAIWRGNASAYVPASFAIERQFSIFSMISCASIKSFNASASVERFLFAGRFSSSNKTQPSCFGLAMLNSWPANVQISDCNFCSCSWNMADRCCNFALSARTPARSICINIGIRGKSHVSYNSRNLLSAFSSGRIKSYNARQMQASSAAYRHAFSMARPSKRMSASRVLGGNRDENLMFSCPRYINANSSRPCPWRVPCKIYDNSIVSSIG